MARTDAWSDPRENCLPLQIGIGDVMPSHAFTRQGSLLLARGERIRSQDQLDRLGQGDVVFSNQPPSRLREAIDARYRTLGLESAAPAASSGRPGDSPFAVDSPLAQELPRAREAQLAAIAQVKHLADLVRSGQPIDVVPVRTTVADIIDSLRRNANALSSLALLRKTDEYTFTHSVNTCILTVMVSEQCGLVDDLDEIGLSGLVHDVGKLAVPPAMLNKPGRLSDDEWRLMRRHPLIGVEILRRSADFRPSVLDAVSQHHERADGSGYPAGLHGDAISPAARLVALADVYDAMTTDRPYRPAHQPAEAIRFIHQHAGRDFDLDLDRAFVRAVGVYPVGSLVRLNTGELAIVAAVNPGTLRRPTVLVIATPWGSALPAPELLDLSEPFIAATKREIISVEDPTHFGIAVGTYLSAAPPGQDL